MNTRTESRASQSPSEGGPQGCALYLPGHMIHYIQARLSWENPEKHLPGLIESIESEIVQVRVADGVRSYRNHDLSRLVELSKDTRDVVIRSYGVLECRMHLFCVAPADQERIPCRGPSSHATDGASLFERALNDGGFLIPGADLISSK